MGILIVLRRVTGKVLSRESADSSHALVRYTPDGKHLIEQTHGKFEILDAAHQHIAQQFRSEVSAIAVPPDGKSVAFGGGAANFIDSVPILSFLLHSDGGAGKVVVVKLN